MLSYLLREPDALALALLLLFLGGTLGLWLRRGRRPAAPAGATGERGERAGIWLSTWPHLVRLELLAALVTLLLLSWWAIALEVPLGPPADPAFTPAVTKAPWFFVGLQELLQYFDAWLAGVTLPLLAILGLCALPYLDHGGHGAAGDGGGTSSDGGASSSSASVDGAHGAADDVGQDPPADHRSSSRKFPLLVGACLLLLCLPLVVGLFFRGEHWALQPAWAPFTPDKVPRAVLRSLGDRLGLEGAASHLLGAGLCLGPFLLLPLIWRRQRRRSWARRLGAVRWHLTGALILVALGVCFKVLVVITLDIRYLWVTPWFRI